MAAFFRAALAAAVAVLTACATRPHGTHQSATGTLSVEFKSGRASLTMQPARPLEVPAPIGTLWRQQVRASFPYTINK